MNAVRIPEQTPTADGPVKIDAQRLAEAYATLKRVARRQRRRGQQPATLSTTALVHEAYLRMAGGGHLAVADDNHLVALCTRTMRHVLVDYCRARNAQKRSAVQVDIDGPDEPAEMCDPAAMLALDQALHAIEAHDARLARIIELRIFGGLEPPDIAELLKVDQRTIQREWQRARIWLRDALP